MGKRPCEHRDPLVRWQRRARNVRRLVYGVLARGLLAGFERAPLPVVEAAVRRLVHLLCRRPYTDRAERHLYEAFGETMDPASRARVCERMFEGVTATVCEIVRFVREGPGLLDEIVDGDEARRRLAEFRRSIAGGWIGVTGHLGNWELLGQWLHHRAPLPYGASIVKRQPNPHIDRLIDGLRRRHGMRTLPRDGSALAAFRMLRRGLGLGTVPDQDVPELGGVFVEFLGRPAYTPLGPARLAYAAGVPLLVGFLLRTERGLRVEIHEPIVPDRSRPRGLEVLRMTLAWSRQIEAAIRAHPEQWPWFHDRWRTTPAKLEQRGRRPFPIADDVPGIHAARRRSSRTG